ncbi:MAG TPA: nucleotidyltransferase [Terriglobales bacterium]|nr:nucleotidyltransferase [Terriglobales bacterium]
MATEVELPVSSSVAPSFPPEQRALFCEVLAHLNQAGVPYVVSGAFALQKHTGIWRNTKDLDLFLPQHAVPEALRHLQEQGFETEVRDPVWLAKAHRDGYFVDLITGMSNAIITVDQSWIDRSSATVVLGVPTRVLAPEELIASKLFVNFRERFDGADIAHILYGTRGRLDWPRLLSLVGVHWELLLWELVLFRYVYPAKQQFVPREIWDTLLSRLRHELDTPSSIAFRGSLVDEKMFAIDVKEWGMENVLEDTRKQREAGMAGTVAQVPPLKEDEP